MRTYILIVFYILVTATLAACATPKQSNSALETKNSISTVENLIPEIALDQDEHHGLYLAYNLYAGGLHAMSIEGVFFGDSTNNNYQAQVVAKPHGWIGKIIRWEGLYGSKGDLKDDGYLQIRQSQQSRTLGNETKTTLVHYAPDGSALSSNFKQRKDGHLVNSYEHNIDLSIAKDTQDLLTAIYTTMRSDNLCKTNEAVFDGKKLFRFMINTPQSKILEPSEYNRFDGDVHRCILDMAPLKGFNNKKHGYYAIQEKSKAKGKQPYLWMKRFPEYMNYSIPVKMQLKSDFGTVIAHLKTVRFIALENRDDIISALK